MTERFDDDVVMITGAGSGIGAVMARSFGAAGARVAIVDIDGAAAGAVAATIPGAIAVTADVSDRAGMTRAFSRIVEEQGAVTVLVNNAMTCADADFLQLTPEEWERDLAVTLTASFTTSQLALPAMLEAGRGVILNIASVNALQYLGNVSYSAAKAGLLSLTRSLAVRYGRLGIRANAIVPGTIVTSAWDHRVASDPDVLENARRWYPAPRLGAPEDIAEAALFLASGRAGWVNGEALVIDGGLMAGNVGMALDIVPGER